MELWNHCENPYPFVAAEVLDTADSARASLPNKYCDPRIAARLYDEVFEEYELCLYAWRPHLYNPRLKSWLHRIRVPSLVLWGASDRIVSPEYGRAYSDLIPDARFELISEAGHHPDLEQPEATISRIAAFLQDSVG